MQTPSPAQPEPIHFYYQKERGFLMYPSCPKCKGAKVIDRHLPGIKTCRYCQGDGSAPLCGLCALPTCEDFACQPKLNLELRQHSLCFDGLRYSSPTGLFPNQPFTILNLDVMELDVLLWFVRMPNGRVFRISHDLLIETLWKEDVTLC